MILLLLWTWLSSFTTAANSLTADCYDHASASACRSLGQKLKTSIRPSDRERGKSALQRACKLGDDKICGTSTPAPRILKRQLVDEKIADLSAILLDARLEPHPPTGYEFVQIEPKSVYELLDFREGDILIDINGHKLESAAQASQLYFILKDQTDFTVRLKRAGQIQLFKYHIEE